MRINSSISVRSCPAGALPPQSHTSPSPGSGLPGDATTVALLYLALNRLILERLTLPGLFAPAERRELVGALVERVLSQGTGSGS